MSGADAVPFSERLPHALGELLAALPEGVLVAVAGEVTSTVVDHFAQDSREVGPGGMFVATRGSSWDGHAFVDTALERGAAVVVAETTAPSGVPTVWVQVSDGLVALAWIAAAWFGHPGRDVRVLATTGTNGKTTTTFLVRAIMMAWGKQTGLISTVEIRIGERRAPTIFTTPPSPELQGLLAAMRAEGCTHAAIEASSHGLHQHRIEAFPVAVAGFTNLTRDHLDYHGTMEAYLAAKARLFGELAERACICIDEAAGRHMAAVFGGRGELLTVSTRGEPADLSATEVRSDLSGVHATIVTRSGESFQLETPLIGRHNVENALVALGMTRLAGVPLDVILTALKTATGAPGRLQRVPGPETRERGGPIVLVDYAHTPDALENVLSALAPLTHTRGGKLVCVFGAGGDRDKGKRPQMAAVAARLADRVIASSDNPRTEDPEAILDDIVAGFPAGFAFARVCDRKAAIEAAIAGAGALDAVLIAGKGHEDYQIIGTTKHPFDDVAVARAALEVWA